jgi:glycosyltransferase involved in cell wall biosynthesis
VGEGPERARLETLRRELKLDEAVLLLGNRADIPDVLAACDVFALTSKMEANPVSILEAMATGKPVVAPRVGSIGESVIEGETGLLTAQGDETEAAEAILRLLADPALATAMGRAGRAVVDARWSLERMIEGYEDLITEIYREKSRGALALPADQAPPAEKPVANA